MKVKKLLYKILLFSIAYVVVTTLFTMPFLVCFAYIDQQKPFLYPVLHPSYAMSSEYITC